MQRQWVAVSVAVLSSAHLDVEADFALTKELWALVGREQQWPKGDRVNAPQQELWQQWLSCHEPLVLRENRTRTAMRRVHVSFMEWLVRHHRNHPRRPQLAAAIGERLLRLGLVAHPRQWSEVLNEQLSSFALLDPKLEPIPWPGVASALQWLEGNFTAAVQPAFQRAIQKKRFREHGEGLHLTGLWETAYISRAKCDVKNFGEVCGLLKAIDQVWPKRSSTEAVLESRFARLHPGTVVVEHTADTNQRIKIHCGVENPSNITMDIGDTQLTWEAGRCYLVDDSYAHQIISKETDLVRTILELKVVHPDLSWADRLDEEGHLETPAGRQRHGEL